MIGVWSQMAVASPEFLIDRKIHPQLRTIRLTKSDGARKWSIISPISEVGSAPDIIVWRYEGRLVYPEYILARLFRDETPIPLECGCSVRRRTYKYHV